MAFPSASSLSLRLISTMKSLIYEWKVSLVLIPSSLTCSPRKRARCVHLILLDFSVSVNVWWWKMWKHPRYSFHCRSKLKHSDGSSSDGVPASSIHGHSFIADLMISESSSQHTHNTSCMREIWLLTLFVAFLLTFDCFPFRTMRLWNGNSPLSLYRSFESRQNCRNILRWKILRGKKWVTTVLLMNVYFHWNIGTNFPMISAF